MEYPSLFPLLFLQIFKLVSFAFSAFSTIPICPFLIQRIFNSNLLVYM